MKIAVIGTGMVGRALAGRLAGLGHDVAIGLLGVALPLDRSTAMPPRLLVAHTDSLDEQIQRAFPEARVVKSLHTVFAEVMVNPGKVPGHHNVFLGGDDKAAKETVKLLPARVRLGGGGDYRSGRHRYGAGHGDVCTAILHTGGRAGRDVVVEHCRCARPVTASEHTDQSVPPAIRAILRARRRLRIGPRI